LNYDSPIVTSDINSFKISPQQFGCVYQRDVPLEKPISSRTPKRKTVANKDSVSNLLSGNITITETVSRETESNNNSNEEIIVFKGKGLPKSLSEDSNSVKE